MNALTNAVVELAKIKANEIALHEDVDVWDAPSECHDLVNKAFNEKMKRFETEIGITEDSIMKLFAHRTSERFAYFGFDSLIGRFIR